MLINIVVRPFKSYGEKYSAGQIISDPASIKRFKSKVIEGKIKVFDRSASDTVSRIRFLEKKLGISIEAEVRAYCKAVDAANEEVVDESVEDAVSEEAVSEVGE